MLFPKAKLQELKHFTTVPSSVPAVIKLLEAGKRCGASLSHRVEVRSEHVSETKSSASEARLKHQQCRWQRQAPRIWNVSGHVLQDLYKGETIAGSRIWDLLRVRLRSWLSVCALCVCVCVCWVMGSMCVFVCMCGWCIYLEGLWSYSTAGEEVIYVKRFV